MEDGSYAVVNVVGPQTGMPFLDVVADTGKFVGSILVEPEKFEGKVLSAAQKVYTIDEVARIIGKVSGKPVSYKQVSPEVYGGNLPPTIVLRRAGLRVLLDLLLSSR